MATTLEEIPSISDRSIFLLAHSSFARSVFLIILYCSILKWISRAGVAQSKHILHDSNVELLKQCRNAR